MSSGFMIIFSFAAVAAKLCEATHYVVYRKTDRHNPLHIRFFYKSS